jgi:hypothetical protein
MELVYLSFIPESACVHVRHRGLLLRLMAIPDKGESGGL